MLIIQEIEYRCDPRLKRKCVCVYILDFFRLIDNLPAATRKKHKETNNVIVYQGYRLGGIMNDQVYINNYLKLKLSYHKHGELVSIPYICKRVHRTEEIPQKWWNDHFVYRNEFRVVGFEVEARSIDTSQLTFDGNTCILPSEASPQFVNPKGTSLLFLYSVEWKQSDVSWASRWDVYLGMSDVEIHWFSIINSLIVVFFLSGENAIIMIA